jgi:hypothetical protein
MTYEPRPGTTAQRVIAHLQLQPPGTELLTSQLGDALGLQALNIPPCLAPALSAGILRQRKKDGHPRAPAYWSLVQMEASRAGPASDGSQKPNGAGHSSSTAPRQSWQPYTPAGPTTRFEGRGREARRYGPWCPCQRQPGRRTNGHWATRRRGPRWQRQHPHHRLGARSCSARARAPLADCRASPQPTGLRVALWSDGALVIERGAVFVASLTAEETRHLVQYLDKVLLDREPATQAA